MAKGPGGGGQKQLSPVVKLVLEHNPDNLAKWRDKLRVSEEAFDNLAYKRRDPVNNLAKSPKAFSLAAQTLINLVETDPDAGLSQDDLSALKSDVFDKTAELIADAEKKKAEAKKKKEEEEARKKEEEAKKKNPVVHSLSTYVAQISDREWQENIRGRLEAFQKTLTSAEAKKLAKASAKGIPKSQVRVIAGLEDAKLQKAAARGFGII